MARDQQQRRPRDASATAAAAADNNENVDEMIAQKVVEIREMTLQALHNKEKGDHKMYESLIMYIKQVNEVRSAQVNTQHLHAYLRVTTSAKSHVYNV